MRRIVDEFSGDFEVMKLLTYEPRLCTLAELKDTYTLDDFHDLLEMVEVQETLKEIASNQNKQPQPPKR